MNKMGLISVMLVLSVATSVAKDKDSHHSHHGANKDVREGAKTPLTETSPMQIVSQYIHPIKAANRSSAKFVYEPDLDQGVYTYIVELQAPSVTEQPALNKRIRSIDANTRKYGMPKDILSHVDYLKSYQQRFLQGLPSDKIVTQYQYALNAVALRLTQDEAIALANEAQVKRISREKTYQTTTDQGPTLIGAPLLWQGRVGSFTPSQGEGVIVGIIDTGINTDHPSFAEQSGDGYVHSNPLGNGVFLGDCAGDFPELCNNKLIGVFSYGFITNSYADTDVFPPNLPRNGEDYGGHGSHVAATAAGNILNDVAESLPTFGEEESDGTTTGFVFEQISGVAPRANIVSFQACFGGRSDQDDTYADCSGAAIIASIEDAIESGVDVLNFSISGGGDPWRDASERAFLSAQSAGIFVATSAGNSGPGVSSSEKHAPWYTSVAASEHGRQNAFVKQLNNFSGGTTGLAPITGQSDTAGISASIVYAGDFANPNDPLNDSAQCLQPFPANTFDGQIVVCDRGEIARVEKAENVASGGAGGFVLANVQGGETFLANDQYVVPGIHITADDGDSLKAWLASGSDHRATITAGIASQNVDLARVDVLAGFSSRGPNTTISTLTPSMTAPGVDIYAAYADQRFGHDGHTPSAGDYNYLSGTSMASPHVAGAAALLKSLKPTWSPDNIRSALAMTASTEVQREDAQSAADFFDMGSGRIRVDLAAQTGLLLEESTDDYLAAEPAIGGEPRSLNLPSITDNECVGICSWSRTFTAIKDGNWTVSAESFDEGLNISVSPVQFAIRAGESQEIEVIIDSIDANKTSFVFGQVNLRAANSPDLHLPVSVLASLGDIPSDVDIEASRDSDSFLIEDIEAITLNSFQLEPYRLTQATVVDGLIQEDSSNNEYLDDLNDGVSVTQVNVGSNAVRFIAEIVSSSASDLDLYVARDRNNDGLISSFEEIAQSTSSNEIEEIDIQFPEPGTYFIIVQNFRGSDASADDFEMRYGVVNKESDDSLAASAPNQVSVDEPFDMRIFYRLQNASLDEQYYGAIAMGSGQGNTDNLGLINVDIVRVENDVDLAFESQRVEAGDSIQLELIVEANETNEDRSYEITLALPNDVILVNANGAVVEDNTLLYRVNKPIDDETDSRFPITLLIEDSTSPGPLNFRLSSNLIARPGDTLQVLNDFNQLQVEGAPSLRVGDATSTTLNVFETKTLVLPISVSDPNGDTVSVSFNQVEGPASEIRFEDGVYSLIAPEVDEQTSLSYELTANDGRGNTANASLAINVFNNEAPTIERISAPASAQGGQSVTISVTASDPENDDLVITIGGLQGNSVTLTTPRTGNSVVYNISVFDGVNTVEESISINLTQAPAPSGNSGGGGGSSSAIYLLILLGLALMRHLRYVLVNRRY